MRLLLDTHIWIWSYSEAHKLSSAVARAVSDPNNKRYLSAVSVWEAIILLEKRRIRMGTDFGEAFERSRQELDLIEIPLSWEVAHELRFTLLEHRDPADRFLVATAKVYDLTLVTADERLMKVPGIRVLANS
jgi:PIN domain nuclease of toxin-antitoxin system